MNFLYDKALSLFSQLMVNYITPAMDVAVPVLSHGTMFGMGILSKLVYDWMYRGEYYRTKTQHEIMAVKSPSPLSQMPENLEPNPYQYESIFIYPVRKAPPPNWARLNDFTNQNKLVLGTIPKTIEGEVLGSPRLLEDKNGSQSKD